MILKQEAMVPEVDHLRWLVRSVAFGSVAIYQMHALPAPVHWFPILPWTIAIFCLMTWRDGPANYRRH